MGSVERAMAPGFPLRATAVAARDGTVACPSWPPAARATGARIAELFPDALLGTGLGVAVHGAAACVPACAVSPASPLLLLLAVLVILAPAAWLRGPWPRATAFVAAYAVAVLGGGLPGVIGP